MVAVSSPNLIIFGWGQPQGMVLPYQDIGGGGGEGLAPKFASEIFIGAANFASKNISDIPNFALWISDMTSRLGLFPNFCVLWWQNFPIFSSYLVKLAWPHHKFYLQTWCDVQAPPPGPPYLELPLGDSEGMTCKQRGYS